MIAAKSAEIPMNTPSAVAASAKAMPPPVDTPPAEDIVDSRVHTFCAILSRVSLGEVEAVLTASGIAPLPELVEAVLRRSYPNPTAAIKFFRWSGLSLRHSPYAWNLMVDILGKNGLFDAMWDAIRSMKQEGVLSLATFASAFSSYCSAGRIKEAVMTFDVMDRYAVPPDVVVVNSLSTASLPPPSPPPTPFSSTPLCIAFGPLLCPFLSPSPPSSRPAPSSAPSSWAPSPCKGPCHRLHGH